MKQIDTNKPLRTVDGRFTSVKKLAHTSNNGEYTWICCLNGDGTNLIAYNMYGRHAGCNRGVDIENYDPAPKKPVTLPINFDDVKHGAMFMDARGVVHFPAEINNKGVWIHMPPISGLNFFTWQGLLVDKWWYRKISGIGHNWKPCHKKVSVTEDEPED